MGATLYAIYLKVSMNVKNDSIFHETLPEDIFALCVSSSRTLNPQIFSMPHDYYANARVI